MFTFPDSASDHAIALNYFHTYALFFLLLVIIFVIWLLKMVLRFSVNEQDFAATTNPFYYYLFPLYSDRFTFFTQYFWYLFRLLSSYPASLAVLLNIFHFYQLTFNIGRIRSSYGRHKTIYPYEGNKINVFPILPSLYSDRFSYRRPYKQGLSQLLALYTTTRSEARTAILRVFQNTLHDVPFLFPYERIDIPSYKSYNTVYQYIETYVYTVSYSLLLKHFTWLRYESPNANHSSSHLLSVNPAFRGLSSLAPASYNWLIYTHKNMSTFLGYSENAALYIYKTHSEFLSPVFHFIRFYATDSRAMTYLFFQHVRHRKVLEWVWTCIPAAILLLLLYPSLVLLYCYDRPYITKPYVTFKAIGHQWYWSYEYSDFVTSSSDLSDHIKFDSYMVHQDDLPFGQFRLLEVDRRIVLPVGVCMRLITTSSDVLHSWAVPALGTKIDAVPGRLNQFWIVSDRPGTFYGQCSELCGVNHGFMPIAVECVQFTSFFDALSAIARD